MNNVSMEIMLIAAIFAAGLTLCFTVSVISGIGFVILANIALPTIIKLFQPSALKTSES